MGRVGTILGSNAIGPSGAEIVAVTEDNAEAVVLRHGVDSYTPPHLIDHGANLRRLAAAGCDRVLAIGSVGLSAARARRRQLRLPRRLHRPAALADHLRRRPRPHPARLRRPLARRDPRRLGGERRRRDRGRRRLLAGDRAAVRDAGGDPADGGPRAPGRDDPRLRVHRRQRARHRLRGGLRGRQHGERDRGQARSRSSSSRTSAGATRSPSATPWRPCSRSCEG